MSRILAIDTSTAWCSVALSIDGSPSLVRHQAVSAGASQLLLPWIEELLKLSSTPLNSLDAIAIGIGPGAFTGVRLGVAVVQGLAIATKLPVLPVASLDAIAAQLVQTPSFIASGASTFVVAVDARMGEVYWAKYAYSSLGLPKRIGGIELSAPELVDLIGAQYLAGSAVKEFGERLLSNLEIRLLDSHINTDISIHALGILSCAQVMWSDGLQQDVHLLEPLYIRNKVALTTLERSLKSHV